MTSDKRHLLKSAYNYTQAGQWDRALDEYRKTARLFPEDPNIHSMIADLLAKQGDPAAGARSQMEAARLYRAQGADDKELSSLRKALRLQAGNAEAAGALRSNIARSLVLANKSLLEGRLDEADAVAARLLEAEPGNLDANRLMDDLKAARLAAQTRRAQEEEANAAPPAESLDAAADVLARLDGAVQAYLQAEDYDNALETLLVMLKLDPSRASVQAQLAQTQSKMMALEAAQAKWQDIDASKTAPVAAAREVVKTVDLEAWRDEEEAVRRRLEEEQRAAEAAAREELDIIETAVRELQAAQQAARQAPVEAVPAQAPAPAAEEAPAPPPEAPEEREDPRLLELLAERELLKARLLEEQALTAKQERAAEEARAHEAEMLKHAIEMARQEAEAQAKAVALRELEVRLEAERESQRQSLEDERRRMQQKEESLQTQMKELMRAEMERLHAEVREQTMRELNERLSDERQQLARHELEARRRESEAEAAVRTEMEKADAERQQAEAAARKERDALEALKAADEARRKAFLDEAVRRRAARQSGAADAKSAVLKNSRRISDVLHAATTRHLDADVEAMLATAGRYLKQDLLLEAMRICQKISEKDPENEKVKMLLKEIYQRKGL